MKVIDEHRSSAKDMAAYEALLAFARDSGIQQPTHEIELAILLRFLKTRSVRRVIESLQRIARTTVAYDVRDIKIGRRYRAQAQPLIMIEADKPLAEVLVGKRAAFKYSIPPLVRQIYGEHRSYTWINLETIASFQYKHSAALYQQLAIKAGYNDLLRRPLEVEARDLAKTMGWSQANDKAFNTALFVERCLAPALNEIMDHAREFRVALHPMVRQPGRGRPFKPLIFEVFPSEKLSEIDRLCKKRAYLSPQMREYLTIPDQVHGTELTPSTAAFSRACHARLMEGGNDIGPKSILREWRLALDKAPDNLDRWFSSTQTGRDIIEGCMDKWLGVDRVFEEWAASMIPQNLPREDAFIPYVLQEPTGEDRIFSDFAYRFLRDFVDRAEGRQLGKRTKAHYPPCVLESYCDPEVLPWSNVIPRFPGQQSLSAAIIMLRKAHPDRRAASLATICRALLASDYPKVDRVVKALFAAKKSGKLGEKLGKRRAAPT
ncbi:RepB family plasmid replication initiator protein [Rhizobium sp. CNPSo 3464]|uniref:RepB family plasmid replication initiator protein n=1 Tax=Rhizobium sp. CNPSo 3464 TaxID=3021406 RepID=UPI00254F956C|nr:RepB family plasmid replication initiator protein [Rhizobium sp. CNPSo 3464]MDK4738062.1 RepB family plasmid replication initiator protein [Rhizobium sp. CNPSo 3464]